MKYTSLAVVSFGAGVALGLSPAQAASRAAFIAPVPGRKDWYTTTGPVQFKLGEIFLFVGDLPKAMAEAMESPDSPKAKSATRVKADAAAKAKAEAEALAREQALVTEAAEAEAKAKAETEAAEAAEAAKSALTKQPD